MASHRRVGSGLIVLILAVVVWAQTGASRTASGAAAPSPRCGGTLVGAIGTDPPHLNVALGSITIVQIPGNPIFEGLIKVSPRLDKWEPELARTWNVSSDGTRFTFNLVRNAKWHDGVPFTSADVKFTFEQVLKPIREPSIWGFIDAVDTPDPYTVIIRLKEPRAILAYPSIFWQEYGAPILPKHLYEGTDFFKNEYNLKPVGTGAFKFKEWSRGSHIILERNKDYRDPKFPYLDRLVFKIVPDPSALVTAFETGDVDYAAIFAKDQVPLMRRVRNVEVKGYALSTGGIQRVLFNHANPILSNVRVRRALTQAVDRKSVLEIAAQGIGTVVATPFASASPSLKWFSDPNQKGLAHDVRRANALLDEAGYPRKSDGTRFQLSLDVDRASSEDVAVGRLLVDMWKAVGVDLKLNLVDGATRNARIFNWEYDMSLVYIVQGPDPDRNRIFYHSGSLKKGSFGGLGMNYKNPEVDALLDRGARTVNRTERARIYYEIEKRLVEDATDLWIYEHLWVMPYRTDFVGAQGYYPPTITKFEDATSVWWKKGAACKR
jgi:peptide/nickel transport system substrate-binding protein